MRRFVLNALVTVVIFASAVSARANLVINGGFELGPGGIGTFAGWATSFGDAATFVDSSGRTGGQAGEASEGLWSAYFGSTAASGGASILQLVSTAVGQTYALSFDFANDNAGGDAANALRVLVAGVPVFGVTNLTLQDYVTEQFGFVATGTSTVLSFAAYNDNGYLQLDNIAILAIPEPNPWMLLIIGIGVLAAVVRPDKERRSRR